MNTKQLRRYAKFAPFAPMILFEYWADWQWYVHPDFAHWLIGLIPILPFFAYAWFVFWRKGI